MTVKIILWSGLSLLATSCESQLTVRTHSVATASESQENSPAAKSLTDNCVDPDLTKVHKGVSLTLCNGQLAHGEMSECAADGVTGCITNDAFKSADMNLLVASNIKTGVTIAGITGNLDRESHGGCQNDGQVGCVVLGPAFKAAAVGGLNPASIRSGVTVAGVSGSLLTCSSNNVVGCVTTSTYKSADITNLAPGNVKDGVVIGGVTGTLTFTGPGDCASDGEQGCVTTATYPAAKASDAVAGNIKSGVTIAGTLGTYGPACSADGGSFCVVDGTDYVAAAKTNAIAGNIKAGVTLAGVTGDYPSATHRLADADGTADLDSATFNAKMKSSTSFEWFDSAGVRYTRAGEPNITPGLILDGISIFGTTGSFAPGGLKVTNLAASMGVGKVVVTWTRTGGSGVIIVRNASAAISFTPTQGVSYNEGFTSGGNKIIYKGTAATMDDADVVEGMNYFYRAFVYNDDNGYSAASSDYSIFFGPKETCGGPGDGCYDDAAAIAAGVAVTPLGKNLEYVTASGSFKVWKEVGSNRILRASGLDEWATKLNTNGKGFLAGTGNEFLNYSSAIGRACPTNVYIDDNSKFSTGNCLYYTAATTQVLTAAGTSQTTDGSIGLSQWSGYNDGGAKWYVGNVQTCATNGMRLPTIYETRTTATAYAKQPFVDGNPTFAQAGGVPSAGTYTWTATACVSSVGGDVCQLGTNLFLLWSGTQTAEYYSSTGSYPLRCVLP